MATFKDLRPGDIVLVLDSPSPGTPFPVEELWSEYIVVNGCCYFRDTGIEIHRFGLWKYPQLKMIDSEPRHRETTRPADDVG